MMTELNNIDYHSEKIVPMEVASEFINAARARIFERVYAIDATNPMEAVRLRRRGTELFRLQKTLRTSTPQHSEMIVAKWGQLLKDDEAFWAEVMETEHA